MNSASKVGDIFSAAGSEFNKLSELIITLHATTDSPSGGRTAGKKKPFEEVTSPLRHQSVLPQQLNKPKSLVTGSPSLIKASEVTLNMLNATHESDIDGDGIHSDFGTAHHEEVTS